MDGVSGIRIAMSGGVDSAVAAMLVKQQGYDCIGITMVTDHDTASGDVLDAAAVCKILGFKHEVVDLTDEFRRCVIDYFVNEYLAGRTPNPCVACNKTIKFGLLADYDAGWGYATGHYARCEYDQASGRYLLRAAVCREKDQSYFLYSLTQRQLSGTLFPMGELTKEEARSMAAEAGLPNFARHDSQDICFIPDGDYAGFIERLTGSTGRPGDFVDMQGRVLGTHRGQLHYTIGQRRGLGLALPEPLYVGGRDMEANQIILCTNAELFSNECTASDVSFCSIDEPREGTELRCSAKIRYAHKPQPAHAVWEKGLLHVVFDEPQRAITPGQSVVLYDEDVVLGGGVIL